MLCQAKIFTGDDDCLKEKFRDARSNLKNAIVVAKRKWVKYLVKTIDHMKFKPKEDWGNMKILKKRHAGCYTKKTTMKLRNPDGNLETSDK